MRKWCVDHRALIKEAAGVMETEDSLFSWGPQTLPACVYLTQLGPTPCMWLPSGWHFISQTDKLNREATQLTPDFFFWREILWFGCEVLWMVPVKFEILFLLISSSMCQGSKFECRLGGWELRVLHSPGSRKDAWPWVRALLGGDPGADGKAGDIVYCALPWTRLLPDTNHLAHYG